MSLTQENAVDLHIVGRDTADLLTTARVGGGRRSELIDPVKNSSLYHKMTTFPLVAHCKVFHLLES